MSGYVVSTLAEAPASARALSDLASLSFGTYPGVIVGDEGFTNWFLRRPGFDNRLSRAAWHDDTLVASVFVVYSPLFVAGDPRSFGIVDTVMTHPRHQRRGLARELLEGAIAGAEQSGLGAMQLYTAPGSPGFRLYEQLGFRHLKRLRYWMRLPGEHLAPAAATKWRVATEAEHDAVRGLIEARRATHDGVPLHDEALWAWRKRDRPASIAAEVWTGDKGGRPSEAVTACSAELTSIGRQIVLGDLALGEDSGLDALSGHLGRTSALTAICDVEDAATEAALRRSGFRPGQEEAAMFLPLADSAVVAELEGSSRPWFPLTESIVGV